MTINKTAVLASLVSLTISKQVGKKREELGKVEAPVPTLRDFGIDVEPTKVEEDGKLVYESVELNWLYNAVYQLATKKARNSLVPGTVTFKDGVEGFAKTLEELCAPAVMGGSPEAALAITEFKNSFKCWLADLGLAAKAQTFLAAQVASPKALQMQPENIRGKVEERLNQWVEWAEANKPELLEKTYVINYLNKLVEACNTEDAALDLDDL